MLKTEEGLGGTLFNENPQDQYNPRFVFIGLPERVQEFLFQAYRHIDDLGVDIVDDEKRVGVLKKQLQGIRELGVYCRVPDLEEDISQLEEKIRSTRNTLAEWVSACNGMRHCEKCRGTGKEYYDRNIKSLSKCSFCKGSGKP